jgi:hypothetical protein
MPIFPAGRRTPSPASLVDRPVRTACGCGRAGAAFTSTVVPLNRTTSWLQSNSLWAMVHCRRPTNQDFIDLFGQQGSVSVPHLRESF